MYSSAGTHPAPVRDEAVSVMREIGVDISAQNSKPLAQFDGQEFDFLITVCDRAREECPVFPGDPQRLHWPFDDPARFTDVGEAPAPGIPAAARPNSRARNGIPR